MTNDKMYRIGKCRLNCCAHAGMPFEYFFCLLLFSHNYRYTFNQDIEKVN